MKYYVVISFPYEGCELYEKDTEKEAIEYALKVNKEGYDEAIKIIKGSEIKF